MRLSPGTLNTAVLTYGICEVLGHSWSPWVEHRRDNGTLTSVYCWCVRKGCGANANYDF